MKERRLCAARAHWPWCAWRCCCCGPGEPWGRSCSRSSPPGPGRRTGCPTSPTSTSTWRSSSTAALSLRTPRNLKTLKTPRKLPTPQEPHQQTPRNPYQRMLRNPPDRPPGNPNLRPPPRAPGRRAWAGWHLSGAPELGAGGAGQRGSPGLCGVDTRAPGTSFSRQGPDLHLPDSSLLAHPPPLYSSGSLNSYLLTFLTTTYPKTIKRNISMAW
ncbi:unnamed protein product [Nyctereutes procyonoides]|uniref:(raccoon dog) hypothetical protein n=1 Tax=Nyctereutes procyonoides TaxID=34880 RepID=A0A811XQL7_NYCPR|nr:unnamed protein product [Nyctereutes procyonoides]